VAAVTDDRQVMLEIFSAIERRDTDRLASWYHDEVEFVWPPSLPYGGTFRGPEILRMNATFAQAWDPVQPSEAERALDPTVLSARDGQVVIHYHQRGRRASGVRIDAEVIGRYELDGGRLKRAQMFYFDPVAAAEFLQYS
jgi:ketosteroid isomerase-like protein